MSGLVDRLSSLSGGDGPLVDVGAVYRRALVVGAVLAVVGAVAAILIGYPLAAIGVVAGLVLGAANNRAFQRRTVRLLEAGETLPKRPFASSVLARLAVVTAVVLYLIYAVPAIGWGAMLGLGAFQVVLLGAAIGALWRAARASAA